MVEAQCFVQLGFPVVLKSTTMVCTHSQKILYKVPWKYYPPPYICVLLYLQTEDIHYVGFLSKLLETKIMQVLRFKYGQVECLDPAQSGLTIPVTLCNIFCPLNTSFCFAGLLSQCRCLLRWQQTFKKWRYSWRYKCEFFMRSRHVIQTCMLYILWLTCMLFCCKQFQS